MARQPQGTQLLKPQKVLPGAGTQTAGRGGRGAQAETEAVRRQWQTSKFDQIKIRNNLKAEALRKERQTPAGAGGPGAELRAEAESGEFAEV